MSASADDTVLDLPALRQSYLDSLGWLLTGMLSTGHRPAPEMPTAAVPI